MELEDLKEALEELKAEGISEDDRLKILYLMYANDEIDLETLREMADYMGYEFTDEFEAMSEHDKKTKGWEREDQPQNKM